MDNTRRFDFAWCSCLWLGLGYDYRWRELAIYLPFMRISIILGGLDA